ncbi:hypothetical protein EGW08_000177, partial [Elysia chlorotica]
HGAECVKRQELLVKNHLAEVLRDSHDENTGPVEEAENKADSLAAESAEKTESIPKAQGVPGIPEAPAVFAEEQENEKTPENETAVPRAKDLANAVTIGEDGNARYMKESLHIAVLVEEGEDAKFACHYCHGPDGEDKPKKQADKDKSRRPMVWYHLSRRKQFGFYKIKEVDLDMHDDPSLNRVYVTATHTLVLREVKVKQSGTYFC